MLMKAHLTKSSPHFHTQSLILSSHLHLDLTVGLFLLHFPTKFYMHLAFPIRATCPAERFILGLITPTISGEVFRLRSNSLRSFLQSPVTFSVVGSNIPLSTLFSNILSLCVLPAG
jgi:hypothetical protein